MRKYILQNRRGEICASSAVAIVDAARLGQVSGSQRLCSRTTGGRKSSRKVALETVVKEIFLKEVIFKDKVLKEDF